jgi:hypothetical protein
MSHFKTFLIGTEELFYNQSNHRHILEGISLQIKMIWMPITRGLLKIDATSTSHSVSFTIRQIRSV